MIGKTHGWGHIRKILGLGQGNNTPPLGLSLHLNPSLYFLNPNLPPLIISSK
jgi:hypothetical protein